jgi:hypothetical protein
MYDFLMPNLEEDLTTYINSLNHFVYSFNILQHSKT